MAIRKTTTNPINGNRIIYFTQAVDAELDAPAVMPAWQTDGSTTLGGEDIDEQTKSGRIIQKESDEHSIELTQFYTPLDPSVKDVENAKRNGTSIKVWEVEVDESVKREGSEGPEYPAKFGYGRPDEISKESGEGLVKVSYTLNIVGRLVDGYFPLSDEDLAVIESLYDYQNPGETTGDYDSQSSSPTGP